MAKLGSSVFALLLLAALQAGCAATPTRPQTAYSPAEPLRLTCDTSVTYIEMVGSIRNTTNAAITFNLDGNGGPPYDPWYLGYRVYSSAPGRPFGLVHNSGHDSVWTSTVTLAPGEETVFNIPLFGLRPADYRRYFQVALRDSKGRSYWTRPFELCAFARANCGCPTAAAGAALACPVASLAAIGDNAAPSVGCPALGRAHQP